jgi:hypothetical protein
MNANPTTLAFIEEWWTQPFEELDQEPQDFSG